MKKPEPYKPRYPRVEGPLAVDESDETALEAHEELLDQMEADIAYEASLPSEPKAILTLCSLCQ